MRRKALEEIDDSEVEDDSILSEDDFSDDDSFFDSDDEKKFFSTVSGKNAQLMKQTKKKTRTQTFSPLFEEAVMLYRKMELFLELCVSI